MNSQKTETFDISPLRFRIDTLYRLIYKFFIFVLLFLYIYTPPFVIFPFSPSYFIILISFIFSTFLHPKKFILFLSNKNIFFLFVLCILIIGYSIFWDLASSYPKEIPLSRTMSFRGIILFSHTFFVSFFFITLFKEKLGYNIYALIKFFLALAFLQSLFVILMIILPDFRHFSFYTLMSFKDEKIFSTLLWITRSYGFSSNYLFSYPVFQGIAVMFALILSLKYSLKYLLYIPVILISIMFNARIGFLAIPLIIIVITLGSFLLLKLKPISRMVKSGFLILLLLFFLLIIVKYFIPVNFYFNTLSWVSGAFINQGSQTLEVLKKHQFFPETITGNIFGQGRYIFMNPKESFSSDIGYINNIFFGGIVFSILLYSYFIFISLVAYFNTNDFYIRVLIISYLLLCFIVNYKGPSFEANTFINAFLIFMLYLFRFKNYQKNGLVQLK